MSSERNARHSLGRRLVLATLGFSLVFTLATAAVRAWSAWQENLLAMTADLQMIERVYQGTLAKALWEIDRSSLQRHIASTGNMPGIGKILVRPASAILPEFERTQPGWQQSAFAPKRHLTLHYVPFAGASADVVGEFWLYGDERVLLGRLRDGVRDIVITQMIQLMLLSGLIVLVFKRQVTVHVERIADHLGQLTPGNLGHQLDLDRHLARPDELTLLVEGVNHLQTNLHEHLEQKARYERELDLHRAQIEVRTEELSKINNALIDAADTLRQLGEIAKDLTMSLDQQEIGTTLHGHLAQLLPVDAFGLLTMDTQHDSLKLIYYVADEVRTAATSVALAHPTSPLARAWRESAELVIMSQQQLDADLVPDGAPLRSGVIRQLIANGQVIGLVLIKSHAPNAYRERELEVINSAASYVAIALANSITYEKAELASVQARDALDELRQAQSMLIQSEKMAALGQLIAGVAHEINTPIGAVKASGRNIADSLKHTLQNLPTIFRELDADAQQRFMKLIKNASASGEVLSSRDERVLLNDLTRQFKDADVANARYTAGIFVQLRTCTGLEEYLPLLRHHLSDLILDTAYSLATLVSNTANINTAVDRVTKIIYALKSFSRVDEFNRIGHADLRDGMDVVLTIYQNQIKHGTELVRKYEELAPVPCWPDELNQVWTNLIHNALQAMDGGGTLMVSIRRIGDEAVVAVSDTGAGIPEAVRAHIFEAFFTTKPVGEGSGLGLNIVKKIIDKHHGRIEVESTVGVGTCFSVYLPYVQPVEGEAPAPGTVTSSSSTSPADTDRMKITSR